MQAFVLDRYGKAEQLRAAIVADPVPGPEDVLIRMAAASLNPLDVKIRNGEMKAVLPYRFPLTLGNDGAGVVVAIGERVTGFAVGDEVYMRPREGRIGTFAELFAVHQDDVARKPQTLGMAEAASVPLVALTAWQALVDLAGVQPGAKVLIHGGGGAVGSMAIQLAKHLGATVATTVGASSRELAAALGADVVIDYGNEDFTALLHDYDLVLDTVGGETLNRSFSVLRPGGWVISIAGPPDAALATQLGASGLVRAVLGAISLPIRRRAKRHNASYTFLFVQASGAQLREIAALIDRGVLRPIMDRTFAFDETADALTYLEGRRGRSGKVVVTMPSPTEDAPS